MGGKSGAAMPRSGGAGKGGRGGRGPMSAEDADRANQTRRQNIYTTVGGLSRPDGARPSGPSGPPTRMMTGPLAAPGSKRPPMRPGAPATDPLLGRDPLTGRPTADIAEGMAASPLSRLFQSAMGPALQGQAFGGSGGLESTVTPAQKAAEEARKRAAGL